MMKNEMMDRLEVQFDKWEKEEIENVNSGKGMRGSNGELSKYSLDDLFNEVIWRLRYESR